MKKILDFFVICFYLIKNNFAIIIISTIAVLTLFAIDFAVWNKTGKSLYKKLVD